MAVVRCGFVDIGGMFVWLLSWWRCEEKSCFIDNFPILTFSSVRCHPNQQKPMEYVVHPRDQRQWLDWLSVDLRARRCDKSLVRWGKKEKKRIAYFLYIWSFHVLSDLLLILYLPALLTFSLSRFLGMPLNYLGMNSILIYCSHGILHHFFPFSYSLSSNLI